MTQKMATEQSTKNNWMPGCSTSFRGQEAWQPVENEVKNGVDKNNRLLLI